MENLHNLQVALYKGIENVCNTWSADMDDAFDKLDFKTDVALAKNFQNLFGITKQVVGVTAEKFVKNIINMYNLYPKTDDVFRKREPDFRLPNPTLRG